jgi:CBS domain-containing protein
LRVDDVMTTDVLAVRRENSFADAARRMMEREVLGALVDPEAGERRPGIVTARDVLLVVAEGHDPRTTAVRERFTPQATDAAPQWSLERAAETMLEGRFRHLVVTDGDETLGVVSIRDIVRAWTGGRAWRRAIQIQEAMSRDFLTFSGDEPLLEAAGEMAAQPIGAAVVDPGRGRPQIITERDVLALAAAGGDPHGERVKQHLSKRMTYSASDWSLKQAAEAMITGRFQHIVVVDRRGTAGIISMRDILRRWLD